MDAQLIGSSWKLLFAVCRRKYAAPRLCQCGDRGRNLSTGDSRLRVAMRRGFCGWPSRNTYRIFLVSSLFLFGIAICTSHKTPNPTFKMSTTTTLSRKRKSAECDEKEAAATGCVFAKTNHESGIREAIQHILLRDLTNITLSFLTCPLCKSHSLELIDLRQAWMRDDAVSISMCKSCAWIFPESTHLLQTRLCLSIHHQNTDYVISISPFTVFLRVRRDGPIGEQLFVNDSSDKRWHRCHGRGEKIDCTILNLYLERLCDCVKGVCDLDFLSGLEQAHEWSMPEASDTSVDESMYVHLFRQEMRPIQKVIPVGTI